MALSGSKTGSGKIYYTDSSNYKTLVFSWTATQNAETNQSTISWSLTFTGNTTGYVNNVEWNVALTATTGSFSGTSSWSGTNNLSGKSGTIRTGTVTLNGNTDGNAAFSVSFKGTPRATSHTCSGSANWSLNQIPRNPLVQIKTNNVWKNGQVRIKTNGVWKNAKKIFIKTNGVWKEDKLKG